jgi:hypothetical protein
LQWLFIGKTCRRFAGSSFGTSPALVVVDIATGRQRPVLATHLSTQPEAGFLAILEVGRCDTILSTKTFQSAALTA